jgi:hypothetical protein
MAADVQTKDSMKETASLELQKGQTKKKTNDYKGFIAGVFSGIAKLSD